MNHIKLFALLTILVSVFSCIKNEPVSAQGELMAWHRVTLMVTGPETYEQAIPNLFPDYRLQVEFLNGDNMHLLPGYFFADRNAAASSASEEFVSLFNGKDLTNWLVQAVPSDADKKYWYVEDGTIVANSMGDSTHDYIWLQSQKEYDDFHLKLKFQAFRDNPGNSGVQIRSRYDEEAFWLDGPQIDINPPENWRTGLMWDETRGNKRWIYPDLPDTLWVNSSMVSQPAPFYYVGDEKEWNEMEIIAKQNRIEAFLNGQKITDFDGEGILNDELHRKFNVGQKGHICLQIHIRDQLKIKYKDIYIKEL